MEIDLLVGKYLTEVTREEQFKTSIQKINSTPIKTRGDKPHQKSQFKHALDLKQDKIKHVKKKLDYYTSDKELMNKEREKQTKMKSTTKSTGGGILSRLKAKLMGGK